MTTLETSRLALRDTLESDADDFIRFGCDPRFYQYTAAARTEDETRLRVAGWIEANRQMPREKYTWTILEKLSGTVIGNIRIWPEKSSRGELLPGVVGLGYGIDPGYWGKGYMTEALIAVTQFAHDTLKMHRVEGAAVAENTGSWRVMEKAGYARESALRYRFFAHGKYWPLFYEYASVRPERLLQRN